MLNGRKNIMWDFYAEYLSFIQRHQCFEIEILMLVDRLTAHLNENSKLVSAGQCSLSPKYSFPMFQICKATQHTQGSTLLGCKYRRKSKVGHQKPLF